MRIVFLRLLSFILSIFCIQLFAMEDKLKKAKEDKLVKEIVVKHSYLDNALEDSVIADLRKIIAGYADDWFCSKEIQDNSEICRIKQLPDGRLIYSVLNGSSIKVIDTDATDSYDLIGDQENHCAEFDFYGNQFVFNSGDNIKTLNLTSGSIEDFPTEHENTIKKLHFLDSNTIVSGSFDNSLKVWDMNKKKSLNTLSEHTGGVGVIENFSKDTIISGSGDYTIKI